MISKNAKWITADNKLQAPVFKKEIYIDDFSKAVISICGLGFFELYINGLKVSKDLFVPAWSNYEKRDFKDKFILYPNNDIMTSRIYYLTYNITKYLKKGNNVIYILLGNGWYRQNKRNIEGNFVYSENLKLIFDIKVNCGRTEKHFVSDKNVEYTKSFIKENNVYYGETHDYKFLAEINKTWKNSIEIYPPDSKLIKQKAPADKAIYKLKPKLLFKDNSRAVYDLEYNLTGRIILKSLNENENITVTHSENINNDFTLNFDSCGGNNQIQKCEYFNCKKNTELFPHFSWQAFRYFEIKGNAEVLNCEVIYSNIKQNAIFECDNSLLNWLYNTYIRTQTNNMHCAVPSDCPHRERLGYTGDGQLTCESAMLNFSAEKFYSKWMLDIADSQDKLTGHIQHTAPFYGGGGGPGGWGIAIVIVPYNYYKIYGDVTVLKKYFPNMLRWLNSMQLFKKGGLIVKELDGGWCLGEWCTPEDVKIPEPYINTYFYIKAMQIIQEISQILNNPIDLSIEIRESKSALKKTYYNADTNSFCNSVQGSDLFAIDLGLADKKLTSNIFKYYDQNNCFDTGIFGTPLLVDLLCKYSKQDIAFKLLTSEKYPSFGYMKNNGATTLWEYWSGVNSQNHPMFGSVIKNLFYDLLGVKIIRSGFKKVEIVPFVPDFINYFYGKIKTKHGIIEIKMNKTSDKYLFNIFIGNIDCDFKFKEYSKKLPKNKTSTITV